jgi:hypothetical protein
VSVDTNVKGKNLSPYRRVNTGNQDLKVLVTPKLVGLASLMRITTRGGLRKKLTVQLSDGSDSDTCEI